MKAKQPKPQTTIVHVAVTTDGPVPMKAVREWVEHAITPGWYEVGRVYVTGVRVKRDADVQKPRG